MKIQEVLVEAMKPLGDLIVTKTVNALVEIEVQKRSKQVTDAYTEWEKLQKRLKRVERPDIITYQADGKPNEGGSYSKARVDEIKKVKERITKIENAVQKALDDVVFDKLDQLGAPMKDGPVDPSETEEAGS